MIKFKNILIYAIFPLLIIYLAFSSLHLFMFPVIILYFTIFIIIQFENILKIFSGFNSKRNKNDKALRYIYKAYKLKNSNIHTALVFIYLLLKRGKYDKAGEIISENEDREMSEYDKHTLLSNKALYYWKKNKISESIAVYEKLMEDGESTTLYGSYGYVIILGDDLTKALELNKAAYKYNPNSKAIIDNLGLTYLNIGNLDKAHELYEILMIKSPGFPEAYYNMAEVMKKMNDTDSAVRYMKKCIQQPFDGLSTITKKDAERKLDQLKRLQGSLK